VDCFNGSTSHVFPDLLTGFGCGTTVLRGQIKEFISEKELREETRQSLDNITRMCRANSEVGVIIGPHGENITILDETGKIFSPEEISAFICMYYLKHKGEKLIYIPVTSSSIIEKLAMQYGAMVTRTSTKIRAPQGTEDIFLSREQGMYPYLEREYDPMIVFLLILEYAALEGIPLAELRRQIPETNLHSIQIPCTIDEKAAIMRYLSSLPEKKGTTVEMIDGIRIVREDAWALVLPDAIQPYIHLYGEGRTAAARDTILEEYSLLIKKYQKGR